MTPVVAFLGLVALAAAIAVALVRHPLYAALALGLDLLSLAAIAWLLSAPAVGLVLVAEGLAYGLMTMGERNLTPEQSTHAPRNHWLPLAGGAAFLILWGVAVFRSMAATPLPGGATYPPPPLSTPAEPLTELLSRYGLGAMGVALMVLAVVVGTGRRGGQD